MTRTIPSLLLAALTCTPALAHDFFDLSAGDAWLETATADPGVSGLPDGETRLVSVTHRFGGWHRLSDFAGFGPLWIHTGVGNRIYVWNGVVPELLVDLDDAEGLASQRVVNLPTGERVELMIDRKGAELNTLTGARTGCTVLSARFLDAANQWTWRRIWFAPGEGIVRWTDSIPGHQWGFYVVYVDHDLEPLATAGPDRIPLSGARDAEVYGQHVLVAGGAGLEVVDLATGQTDRSVALPGEPQRVERAGRTVFVSTLEGQRARTFSIILTRQTTVRELSFAPTTAIKAIGRDRIAAQVGDELRLGWYWSDQADTTIQLGPWHELEGATADASGLLYVPRADHPGAITVVDPAQGRVVRTIEVPNDSVREVVLDGATAWTVATFGVRAIDLATGDTTHDAGGLLYHSLRIGGGRLFGIASSAFSYPELVGYDTTTGAAAVRATIPEDLRRGPLWSLHQIVDAQGDRLLILDPSSGLGWVSLRRVP